MHTYAAFLRGVNLGNRNKVPMAALRDLLGRRGFSDVRTHLQSGNVVAAHESADAGRLAKEIQDAVADEFGVQAPVVVRTAGELVGIVDRNPLGGEPDDPARFLVAFLEPVPAPARVRELEARGFGEDRLWCSGREAYLWCPNGIRDSDLGRLAWDRHLGVTATTRNWNTVTRLAAMVSE